VLDFGAVDRLPDGFPPFIGHLLRIVHEGADLAPAEQELRAQGFLRPGIEIDPEALRAFLAPLAEPSRVERFRFSREWLRGEATRVADPRSSNLGRKLNLPPSYVLIHRVTTAGMGVLCQLECEGPYRAEVLRWMPGYNDQVPSPGPATDDGPDVAVRLELGAGPDAAIAADNGADPDVAIAADSDADPAIGPGPGREEPAADVAVPGR